MLVARFRNRNVEILFRRQRERDRLKARVAQANYAPRLDPTTPYKVAVAGMGRHVRAGAATDNSIYTSPTSARDRRWKSSAQLFGFSSLPTSANRREMGVHNRDLI